jgi:hypothetical protein
LSGRPTLGGEEGVPMRQIISTAVVAVIVSVVTATAVGALAKDEPATTAITAAGINADKVDGRHAVSYTNIATKRANKLVATNANGYLPSNIIRPKWALIKDRPSILRDGKVTWAEVSDKPTIPGGSVAWPDVTGKPATLADGKVAWGEVTNKPAILDDKQVGWGEVQNKPAILDDKQVGWGEVKNKPAGFADGKDNVGVTGVTIMTVEAPTQLSVTTARASQSVDCPAGFLAIGGGPIWASLNGPGDIHVIESAALDADTWRIVVVPPTFGQVTLRAQVTCLRAEPNGAVAG